jgi:hypothetical protein
MYPIENIAHGDTVSTCLVSPSELIFNLFNSSEHAVLRNKDIFLVITMFLSIKNISRLRTVCRSFNQWLSDPNNFAWKNRIRSAFPNSYNDYLKEEMNDQIQRLLLFDTLVEEDHSVSYFSVDNLTLDKPSTFTPQNHFDLIAKLARRLQLPWRKELFIILVDTSAVLFSATTRSVMSKVHLLKKPQKILFNINGKSI